MRILQFQCPYPDLAAALKQRMLDQINTWSRLQRLASDPAYGTDPFGMDQWHTHQTDASIHWADWDAIYANLGDDGRKIADQMLGTGPLQGILRMAPLVQQLPNMRLEMLDVPDPVAAGYLPDPETVTPETVSLP